MPGFGGLMRDAMITISSFLAGLFIFRVFGLWGLMLVPVWVVLFARVLHGEWIWEWWH